MFYVYPEIKKYLQTTFASIDFLKKQLLVKKNIDIK